MSKFHLYHISFFDSLLDGLKSSGVSLEKLTHRSFIRRFDLNNPDTYLPIEVAYGLLEKVKHTQAIDSISGEFYSRFQVDDLSNYGQHLSSCPDLYSMLIDAIKYDYLIQTNGKLSLKTEGVYSWYSMVHKDAPSAGRHISERITLAMLIKAFQYILGSDWIPLEVHITGTDGKWLENIFPSLDFKLKTSCPEISFKFKTEELAVKNKYYSEIQLIEHKDMNSIDAITVKVLNSLRGNYFPTLAEFSTYFGFSHRTLIRSFAKAETSFKEILEKQQFLQALKLMEDQTLSIREISAMLGYAHTSNFIRAFKRWTSTTPYKYRQQFHIT